MIKRKISLFIVFILSFTLCFSQSSITKAAESNLISDAKLLTISKPVKSNFKENETVHWYKISPLEDEVAKFTHFQVKFQAEQQLNISVYSSIENAQNDKAFDRYRGNSIANEPAIIDFPIAWTGPYYIKVEYGEEDLGDGGLIDNLPPMLSLNDTTPAESKYIISYKGVNLPPSDGINGESCPVELSTEAKGGNGILRDLRSIRETLLSKTDNGKELSSFYYKVAPFLSAKMIVSQSLRDDVYNSLTQLNNLFADVAENGKSSSYIITKKDQEAINNLYKISRDSVPESLKKQLDKIASDMGISNLTNLNVSTIINKAGLASSDENAEIKNRYIVKLKDGYTLNKFKSKANSFDVKSINPLNGGNSIFEDMVVVQLNDNKLARSQANFSVQQMEMLPEVEFVEKVQEYHSLTIDSQYSYQWALKNSGKNEGIANADIQYEPLMSLIKGKKLKDTLVAVVDTGVDHTLKDLSANVKSDQGKNYINPSNNALDDNGHGTHVAGIIAATANNNYSMAGVSTFAKILPVKVLDSTGSGSTEQIVYGIKYAVDKGAKVINLSLGGSYSRSIEYALQYANKKNVTVIAASGNDGVEGLSYPASSKYVISVGATNRLDLVSDYSNYGKGLDLVAPGTDIPSIVPDGNVTYMSGTSMAAPYVAGVASLLIAQNPNLKPDEVESLLTKTATDVVFNEQDHSDVNMDYLPDGEYPIEETIPGYDPISGWGRLNAYSAFSALELKAKVNALLDNQTKITGYAKEGSTVKVMDGKKQLGSTKVKANSTYFAITIPVQKPDKQLEVVITNNKAKAAFRIAVEKAPKKPVVNPFTNKDSYVTGNAEPNLTVNVKNSSRKVIQTSKVDKSGSFKVQVNKQKENSILYVTVTDDMKRESTEVKISVVDAVPPSAPKVNEVSDKDVVIKGNTEANASVTAKVDGKVIGSVLGKDNKTGSFEIKIKKQKANSTISITAKDVAGNISEETKIKVKDKTPPTAPQVYSVNDKSTVVKGKTEAYATVL